MPSPIRNVGRSSPLELENRRRQINALLIANFKPNQIARRLGIPTSAVARDIQAINQEWREKMLLDFADLKAKELARLDIIEQEAWDAWYESRRQQVVTEVAVQNSPRGEKTSTKRRDERRDPDGRYLEIIMKCSTQRQKMLGLDQPRQIDEDFRVKAMRMAKELGVDGDELIRRAEAIARRQWELPDQDAEGSDEFADA